jgi:4-amino-4-deoxy-L-arabinose transferase-like glycosyltransferase
VIEARGTTAAARTPSGSVHRFATRPVAAIAASVALAHVIASMLTSGYWLDEAYVLATGRHHLAWGSADQPPLAAALAWLADTVAPGSVLALRLPAILATTAAVVVAALIARELGGDRRAQVLTAAAQATGLFAALTGHWLTPYAFEPLEWLAVFWLLVRWIRVRDDRLLLALGLVVGVALMTKVQILALGAVLLVAVAVCGPRELLRRPLLWVGAALALLAGAPTLLWQAAHGWPQLGMTAVVAREVELIYGGRPALAWELVGFGGLLGAGLALAGLWWLLRDPVWREYRFLGVGFVVLYAAFLATEARPYYLLGHVGVVAAIGAVGFSRRRGAGARVWPAWAAGVASALAALVVLGLSPLAAAASPEREEVAAVAAELRTVPDPARTAVVGQTYPTAAYLDAYGAEAGLPPAFSTNRGYGWFAAPPDGDVDVLYVGADPRELVPHFRDVRPLGGQGDARTWLLTGRTQPWAGFWPGLRHLGIV